MELNQSEQRTFDDIVTAVCDADRRFSVRVRARPWRWARLMHVIGAGCCVVAAGGIAAASAATAAIAGSAVLMLIGVLLLVVAAAEPGSPSVCLWMLRGWLRRDTRNARGSDLHRRHHSNRH
ncbi:MAG TPA: DUF3040 domain-containing protein [Mycobacteriales bacterium]|nr:DUF3040 domain-containing protein [Mycobacteriales bacterium]